MSLPMLALFCTTPQSSMRQTRINTQNMTVLTVEFTRIPLSRRGRSHCNRTSITACIHPLDARTLPRSHRKYTTPARQTQISAAWMSSNYDCTPKPAKLAAICSRASHGRHPGVTHPSIPSSPRVTVPAPQAGRHHAIPALRLQFHALHPHNPPAHFQHRPNRPAAPVTRSRSSTSFTLRGPLE